MLFFTGGAARRTARPARAAGPQPRAVLFACAQLAVQQHEKQTAVTQTKIAPL
jgi:hypothetical protein